VKNYWNFREELAVYNGLVFKADQVVIPSKLRAEVLKIVHAL
jgi:hypothetical protein